MANHEPSKRKLEKARKDGQFAKSSYFSQSFPMLVVITILTWQAPKALVDFKILLNYTWVVAFTDPERALSAAGRLMLQWSLVLLGCAASAGIAAEFAQIGFVFDPQHLLPKAKRLDFSAGALRVLTGLINPWPLILRGVFMASVMYISMRPCILALPSGLIIGAQGWANWFAFTCARLFKAFLLALLVNGLFDYGLKWRAQRKKLMMTEDEVRREHKDDEGDPLMKHLRKHEHQALISQEVIRKIRQAKVLVVESQ